MQAVVDAVIQHLKDAGAKLPADKIAGVAHHITGLVTSEVAAEAAGEVAAEVAAEMASESQAEQASPGAGR